MSALLVEFLKGLWDLKGAMDDVQKYTAAVERASRGESPFKGPAEYEKALSKLEAQTEVLKKISREGIGHPPEKAVGLAELSQPRTRPWAVQKLRENLAIREKHQKDAKELLGKVQGVEKEASIRSKAARELSRQLLEMVKLPTLTTAINAQFLELSELASKGAGRLSSLASAADRAGKRIETDLKVFTTETNNLRGNMNTFGLSS